MRVVPFTLVADGSSDQTLVPIIEWVLSRHLVDVAYTVSLARGLPPHAAGIYNRARSAKDMYPCDFLLIHRDAEGASREVRLGEINAALSHEMQNWLPVIPVRMTEAWLLFDEAAIRKAAGKSDGRGRLNLPRKGRWEREPDPKEALFRALRTASELNGRRLGKFNVFDARLRVAALIDDYSPLCGLASFDRFVRDLQEAIEISGLTWAP